MMQRRKFSITITLIILGAILVTGVLSYANYKYVKANPGGNDFLVYWKGFRVFFQKGTSPYSDETALEIQNLIYRGPAQTGQHQMRFVYPLYSVVLFGPFAAISDYETARTVWMTLSELAIISLVIICISITKWKPSKWLLAVFIIFSLFWYHSLRPLINGNAVVFIALAISGFFLAIKQNQDELAGVILGLCTIKPQVVVFFIIFVFFWAIVQRRAKIILWFFISVILLGGAAALLIPDWIIQNLREVLRYSSYSTPGTPATALNALIGLPGMRIGTAISVLAIALALLEIWINRKADFRGFLWVSSLVLVVSQWSGIATDPGNFIVCFPALVLTFSIWQERWKKTGTLITIITIAILMIGVWAIFLATIEYTYQPVQSPIMFFPLPIILFFCLYWIRWWTLKPSDLWAFSTPQLHR
jgi:hypothetical protein